MKRNLCAILVAVLLLPALLSVGGCAGRVGFGIDTFAAIPQASAVATPDQAEVALYALVVKIVAPSRDLIVKAHDAKQISDARFIELMQHAKHAGEFSRTALDAIERWRTVGDRSAFDAVYPSAVAAASKVVDGTLEVKR